MTIVEHSNDSEIEVDEAAETVASTEGTPRVEVLVEEISIDGMCGVY